MKAKLLLDEGFFDRNNVDGYFDDVIKFIKKYFLDDIVLFYPYCNPGNIWMKKNFSAIIERKIVNSGKYDVWDLNLLKEYEEIDNNLLKNYSSGFVKKIKYIVEKSNDVIIFNTPENHFMTNTHPSENIFIVNHIKRETNSNISMFVQKGIFVDNIINPTLASPLPNVNLCDEYVYLLNDKCSSEDISARVPYYIEIGEEVIKRNKYTYNSRVSNINRNSGVIRKIYSIYKGNKTIYASIDVDTGSIEIFNHRGKHQDEYSYTNTSHNKQDVTGNHDIRV